MVGRGLIRHCPNCGSGHLFRGWFRMVDCCPRCGHRFDREEGFWLGAYVINFAVTEAALAVVFAAYIVMQARDNSSSMPVAPWLVAGLIVAVGVPLLFYPFSKTIWAAIDLVMHGGAFDTGLPSRSRFGRANGGQTPTDAHKTEK